jgi:serine/threonine protein kinase
MYVCMCMFSGTSIHPSVAIRKYTYIQTIYTYVHTCIHTCIHTYVQASNCFLDAQGNIKIGDLGLGKILTGAAQCAMSKVGTPLYFSPEICEGRPYDTKSDIWALGCLMYELATMRPPFHAQNQIALAKKIVHEQPDFKISSKYSKELHFIIGKLMDKDPRKRPSPESLLSFSAIQIRVDRARFSQRESELLRMVETERSRNQASQERAQALLEELDRLNKETQLDCSRHVQEVQDLQKRIGILETRCSSLEDEKTTWRQQLAEHQLEVETYKMKLEALERWEKELAKRELQVGVCFLYCTAKHGMHAYDVCKHVQMIVRSSNWGKQQATFRLTKTCTSTSFA